MEPATDGETKMAYTDKMDPQSLAELITNTSDETLGDAFRILRREDRSRVLETIGAFFIGEAEPEDAAELAPLAAAAVRFYNVITNMTSRDFSHGADREARNELEAALKAEGIDPDSFPLENLPR